MMKSKALPYLAGVSAAIAISAGVWILDRSEQQRFQEQRRTDTLNQLSTTRAKLEGSLNSRLFLTEGLVAHVSTHPNLSRTEFENIARVLAAKQTGIRIIELAKNTAISHIYPPEHKAAVGMNLLEKPQEQAAIERAIRTKRPVVAGPIYWSDGTAVFISHTPIFISAQLSQTAYWGLATIILDKQTLLKEAGLLPKDDQGQSQHLEDRPIRQETSPSTSPLSYALRGQDGLGAQGVIFSGDPAIFQNNPVILDVSLPNGSWQLAAIPVGGWVKQSPIAGWLRVGGGSLALLTGILVFVLVREPARSREAVERATVALLRTNDQLQAVLQAVPGIVAWIDSDLRFLGVNRHLATSFDLSPEDFLGQGVNYLGNREFTEFVSHFFASSDREASCEVTAEVNGTRRIYLFVAQKYDQDRAAFTVGIDITKRKQAEEQLRTSEAELRALFAAMTDTIIVRDREGRTHKVAPTNPTLLYQPIQELLGKTLHEIFDLEQADRFLSYIRQALETRQTVQFEYILPIQNEDIWFAATISPMLEDSVLWVARDVTQYKKTEEALRQAEEKYRSIFENAVEGIFQTTPDGRYLSANPALARIYGYSSPRELIEQLSGNKYQRYVDPQRYAEFLQLMQEGGQVFKFESQIYRADNRAIWISESGRAVRDAKGELLYYEGLVEDITDRKQVEEQLLHSAFHDALTGLPNRLMFMDRLRQAIRRAKENDRYRFAVLFLDLDRFKVVNDSLGHLVGDQLLISFARRLETILIERYQISENFLEGNYSAYSLSLGSSRSLPPFFTIARLGGDEFTILLENIHEATDATTIAEGIHKALMRPFNLNGHELFTSSSIGIVLNWQLGIVDWELREWEVGGEGAISTVSPTSSGHYLCPIHLTAEDLLRNADIAMYRAKAMGKACHAVFDRAMYANAVSRLQLETELRRALTVGEFEVYYQPIVSLKTSRISGFEALVRWQHPSRGLISPSSFIPLAEETGLIIPLGLWVLQEACRQTRIWQVQFPSHPLLTISVNLSGQQFSQPDLTEKFEQILQETGLDPRSLKLEITESVITEGAGTATAILKRLRQMGIQLCIDDFGIGYSSLSRLHHFPINTLKIDRSFISRLGKKGTEKLGIVAPAEIVQTILMLAHNLGMDAIAEGVETVEQLDQLKHHKCEYGQGYFFSRPLTGQAATDLLAQQV